ncbi:hypothetical protein bcere0022_10570 [Bacillus cereus Rock3-44]|nr:hypothetical protein bcere0022_10570 [Bacillus cereus Rock3-44]
MQNFLNPLASPYTSILIIQHISRCYEEEKVTSTCFLSLFSPGRG